MLRLDEKKVKNWTIKAWKKNLIKKKVPSMKMMSTQLELSNKQIHLQSLKGASFLLDTHTHSISLFLFLSLSLFLFHTHSLTHVSSPSLSHTYTHTYTQRSENGLTFCHLILNEAIVALSSSYFYFSLISVSSVERILLMIKHYFHSR